ncbi:MAG TPA: hypothetical protein H9909_01735 [Candidatus Mediterraneibacter norfolkensis]|nr:hypothetical protein [Candidatus Mediterraneibacter norfolkensis]
MKNGLRYLIAVLLAGSLGIWFIPLLDSNILELSVMDVMKVGLGFYSGLEELQIMFAGIQTQLRPYAWGIAGAALFVLIEAFFTSVLGKRKSYVVSLAGSILNGIVGGVVFFLVWKSLEEMKQSTLLALVGDAISLSFIPLIAWEGVCLLILILSVIGLLLWASSKSDKQEDIYIEQITRLEQEKKPEPEERFGRETRQDTDHREVPRHICRETAEQQSTGQPAVQKAAQRKRPAVSKPFTGALLGANGMYAGKAYPLEDRTEVFFRSEDGKIIITPYESRDNLGGIYYVDEYQEYCVEPSEIRTVFLESGQPLGKGRQYYLPRGTKIYLKEKENQFILA